MIIENDISEQIVVIFSSKGKNKNYEQQENNVSEF